ncbi:hypothetical protein DICSQDRAFT_137086 [Dichomitus squalens LYAD-421 SS1]|uniref:Uncharacterized protein n=2 Tax=Dichomitus squalens TaxID=114155 RepID=A0A4Q9MKB6_9APHY|nr:uncharacterized protein DICSQDRAFT_137086 [Dichomitus squalens LYAD-421 SS1]EJF60866.1 hypothetical protein DICSQDRAFT_137086 [Dichomitus squalens LYAD-421 SS1]TBU26416.1 hypothetical protein BD311DRAFT_779653 [Dichomitus squalens]
MVWSSEAGIPGTFASVLSISYRGPRFCHAHKYKSVLDVTRVKALVEWVLPDFTASTLQNVTAYSVQLMSTLKPYA